MFLQDADMICLRQGDILQAIPFPIVRPGELVVLGHASPGAPSSVTPALSALTTTHRDDPNWLTAQLPVRLSFCALISQCCDLEARYGKLLMPAFAAARLIPIPAKIVNDPQRLASLRENKDPRRAEDPGYINFFYVPAHERLERREWVVDFNQMVSIPGAEFPRVLGNKVLQMEVRWRVKFKIKLAASLTRLTAEEREAGLEQPWEGTE